jgi:hypothetical protein
MRSGARALRPQPWPWTGRRVLIEHPDEREGRELAAAYRRRGYAVALCTGPAGRGACPLVTGEGCAIAETADGIVSLLGSDTPSGRAVHAALRERLPRMPVVDAAPRRAVRAPERQGRRLPVLRNPFRSEAAAFRFVLVTAAAFAAVGVADAVGGVRAGVAAWAALSALALVWYARRSREPLPLATAPAQLGAPDERRLVVLAEEELSAAAADTLRGRADRLLVVAPATAPRLRRWLSDVDGALADARARADATVARLANGSQPASLVGDGDPLRALEDALRTFGGDEVVVSTRRGRAGEELAARVAERFALPVTHVVAT